jgi:hypothetical protein
LPDFEFVFQPGFQTFLFFLKAIKPILDPACKVGPDFFVAFRFLDFKFCEEIGLCFFEPLSLGDHPECAFGGSPQYQATNLPALI